MNNLQDVTLLYDQTGTAPGVEEGKLVLKGYLLESWNTAADGTGKRIEPGGELKNLTAEDGGKVTLYAQWRAWAYEIELKGLRDSSPSKTPIIATYDKLMTLESFKSLGYEAGAPHLRFLGWKNITVGNGLYPDQANVVNLCSTDETGKPTGYTLEATWGEPVGVYVVAMNTDENGIVTPLSQEETEKLSLFDGTNNFELTRENEGICFAYVQPGEYELYYDDKPTGLGKKTATEDSLTVFTLHYGTIKTKSGEGLTTEISLDGNEWKNELKIAYDPADQSESRTKIYLRSTVTNDNYKFQSYAGIGVPPNFESMYEPEQTLTINGSTTIESHSVLKSYAVKFDANAADATGNMRQETFEFGEEKKLSPNAFQRLGYSFASWNTAADGTGTAYEDGAQAKNLTTEDGATVTLYAQWTPEDEGELDPNPGNPDQKPAPKPESPAAQPGSPSGSNDGPQNAAANEAIARTGDSIPAIAATLAAIAVAGAAVLVIAAKKRSRKSGR